MFEDVVVVFTLLFLGLALIAPSEVVKVARIFGNIVFVIKRLVAQVYWKYMLSLADNKVWNSHQVEVNELYAILEKLKGQNQAKASCEKEIGQLLKLLKEIKQLPTEESMKK